MTVVTHANSSTLKERQEEDTLEDTPAEEVEEGGFVTHIKKVTVIGEKAVVSLMKKKEEEVILEEEEEDGEDTRVEVEVEVEEVCVTHIKKESARVALPANLAMETTEEVTLEVEEGEEEVTRMVYVSTFKKVHVTVVVPAVTPTMRALLLLAAARFALLSKKANVNVVIPAGFLTKKLLQVEENQVTGTKLIK